jgi:hypothetical protein
MTMYFLVQIVVPNTSPPIVEGVAGVKAGDIIVNALQTANPDGTFRTSGPDAAGQFSAVVPIDGSVLITGGSSFSPGVFIALVKRG